VTVWISIARLVPSWVHEGLTCTREDDGGIGFRYPALSRMAERARIVELHEWLCESERNRTLLAALVDELVPPRVRRVAA
jgi:hypothetical protein